MWKGNIVPIRIQILNEPADLSESQTDRIKHLLTASSTEAVAACNTPAAGSGLLISTKWALWSLKPSDSRGQNVTVTYWSGWKWGKTHTHRKRSSIGKIPNTSKNSCIIIIKRTRLNSVHYHQVPLINFCSVWSCHREPKGLNMKEAANGCNQRNSSQPDTREAASNARGFQGEYESSVVLVACQTGGKQLKRSVTRLCKS